MIKASDMLNLSAGKEAEQFLKPVHKRELISYIPKEIPREDFLCRLGRIEWVKDIIKPFGEHSILYDVTTPYRYYYEGHIYNLHFAGYEGWEDELDKLIGLLDKRARCVDDLLEIEVNDEEMILVNVNHKYKGVVIKIVFRGLNDWWLLNRPFLKLDSYRPSLLMRDMVKAALEDFETERKNVSEKS